MRKLSEVCKIVGITRRTLQGYNEIGLLRPTATTEGGYWLYDDNAISKLMLIQVLVEAGYRRKEIKELFKTTFRANTSNNLEYLIETLEEKRNRIDGVIHAAKILKMMHTLPSHVFRVFENRDISPYFISKDFRSLIGDCIVQMPADFSIDEKEMEDIFVIFLHLISIADCMGMPEDSEKVQREMEAVFRSIMRLYSEEETDICEILPREILLAIFLEFLQEYCSNTQLNQMFESFCGEGYAEYIIRAAHVFSENQKETNIEER